MNRYNLDYETRSSIDIKRAGAYRYADDPSTDITLVAISKNREPVRLWDRFAPDKENAPALEWLREAASDPEATISCFNVGFEVAITTYHWERTFGFKPPLITQWRCSQALCRTAAIPQSLEAAAEFLKLPFQKNKIGSALIQKFCVPQKDGTWIEPDYDKLITVGGEKMSAAKAWHLFREYAIRDVETERAMGERLKILELKGWMLEGFQLDLRMNMRGVPINLDAVRYAQQIVDEYNGKIASRFREITGLNASQTAKVLAWMQERGYPGDNMQVGTVTEVLTGEIVDEDGESTGEVKQPLWTAMTPEAVEALQLKSLIGYAALKKLPTMERTACTDGRVRGMFTWWGAIRTGRHTSKILQLQNCKRSTKLSEKCYNAIAQGGLDADDVEMLFGPPPELIATCIRHFIDPGDGKEFIDVDFSQIEARVLPWLAGDTATLDAFRAGHDAYVIAASTALGVPMDQITKDQRQLGKVIVLACGFGGGLGAMSMACKTYGIKMTDKEKMKIVRDWRKANKPITDLWKAMQDGMVQAILNPGTWVQVNDKCRYGVDKKLGYRALILEIPSGRRLQYPYPEAKEVYKIKRRKAKTEPVDEIPVEGDEDAQMEWVDIPKSQAIGPDGELYKGVWKTYEVSYFGPPKGSQKWCRVRTHGGVGAENLTQSTAGDFLTLGAVEAEKRGYGQVITVHDQLITEYWPERGNTVDGLVDALCQLPSWAKDFPLNAVGELADFYTKS